jgi:hypothetical protein
MTTNRQPPDTGERPAGCLQRQGGRSRREPERPEPWRVEGMRGGQA